MNWDELDNGERYVCSRMCEQSLLFFSRSMFRFNDGGQFMVNWHHHLICDELEKIESGETDNLIINVSPGGSKTHLVSICFPARGLAREPKSRFLMVSYSAELVGLNSTSMRDLVKSHEFQEMWPTPIASDSNDKKLWQITDEKGRKQGAFRGASNGGQIMGFRAGRLQQDKYYGTLILDDVSNPVDMLTEKRRENSNRIWERIRSRYGSPKTPTVLIQQRLHEMDATGFKLDTMRLVKEESTPWREVYEPAKSGGKRWVRIVIPALIDDEYVNSLPEKYRRRVTGEFYGTDDKGRFSYWPEKETLDSLLELEHTSPYMFKAQYQQEPVALSGKLMPPSVWHYWNRASMPNFEWRFITGDTALKPKEVNDFTVFAVWGVANGNLYLIDYIRGRWVSPKMRAQFLRFVGKHNNAAEFPIEKWGKLRSAHVEDAASGIGLLQELRTKLPIGLCGYKPNRFGKAASCSDTLPFLETEDSSGRVFLCEDMDGGTEDQAYKGGHLTHWIAEHAAFTGEDGKGYDDCCDNTFMAVTIGLRNEIVSGGAVATNSGLSEYEEDVEAYQF